MTSDGWVVIGSHDSADGAGCLRIAGPGRDFFVCHRLPFRDLPHDVANFVGEAFHIPSVALLFDFVTGFFTLACNSLPAASRYPQYSKVGLAAGIVSPRRQSFILKISGSIQSVSPLCGMTFHVEFELAINLKTARALGLAVPATLLDSRRPGDRIGADFLTHIAAHAQVSNWPMTSLVAMRQFRRYRGISELVENALDRALMTRKRHAGVNSAMTVYRSKARASRAIAGAMI